MTEFSKVSNFIEEYGIDSETVWGVLADIGYDPNQEESTLSELAVNEGYRYCFSHQKWFSRDNNYNEEEQTIFDALTNQNYPAIKAIGTEVRYCGISDDFYKAYKKYKIVDYLPFSERPYEVACEEGKHNGGTLPQCSYSQEDLDRDFEVPNPKVELRETEKFILIAGKAQITGFYSVVEKETRNQSHWFGDADKSMLLNMTEENFDLNCKNMMPDEDSE